MDRVRMRRVGRICFACDDGDGYSMADPVDTGLVEAMYRARYALDRLSQSDAYRILGAVESYIHLATHPAPHRMIEPQLRALRRAVRLNDYGEDEKA